MTELAEQKSLDAILEDFVVGADMPDPTTRKALTIWLSPEHKERYDRIQRASGRRFCDKVRELIIAAIDRCDSDEAQAS